MDQEEKFAYKRWLATASDHELQVMEVRLLATQGRITESGALADFRYLRKGLYQEMQARRELAAVINHRKD